MRYFGLILCWNIKLSLSQNAINLTNADLTNADLTNPDLKNLNILTDSIIPHFTDTLQPDTLQPDTLKPDYKIVNKNNNLDHQFQIRSSLDSSLCLTRSKQQKLILEACDLKRASQWFKHNQKSGLISNGDGNKDFCLLFGNNNSDNCDKLDAQQAPQFTACDVQDTKQSWLFDRNRIQLMNSGVKDGGGGEGGAEIACSINIDQHDEFRRVYAIPDQFDRGLPQLIKHTLNSNLIKDVMNHGCWCAKLNGEASVQQQQRQDLYRYSQTMVPIDRLDTICRDWMNTRKCVLYKGGACFRQPRDGRYLLALDNKGGSLNNEFRCLDEQHIISNNTSVDCLNDTCRIDKFYIDQIRDYFFREKEENKGSSLWRKIVVEQANCLPEKEEDDLLDKRRSVGVDSNNNNNSLFGNTKKKYSRPRVRICSGKAPHLVFESVEPPKPKRTGGAGGGMVQIPGFPALSKKL